MTPLRLLVCGFGPFPGFPDNPAGQVVQRLADAHWRPPAAEAAYALMPTTWQGGPATALEALERTGATGVLLVGVAGAAAAFRVETLARNGASLSHVDADGALHPKPLIDPRGQMLIPATAPVAAMAAAVAAAGLPIEPSENAGDYLCNYTFYRLLAAVGPEVRVGFLHIPPPGQTLSLDDLERGVQAAASAFAEALAPRPVIA